jgi:hypothetical protein
MSNVEHSTLTGSDLHESKGVAAAANNRVYVTNGAGSGSFQQVPAAAIASAGVLVFQGQLYHIRDERSSGTSGGSLTNNTWNTRTLQTEKTDDLTITTSGNQIPLVAGTYWVEVEATTWGAFGTGGGQNGFFKSQLRLRNITDSTTTLMGPHAAFYNDGSVTSNNVGFQNSLVTTLRGRFTIAGTKTFELQNWTSISGTISSSIKEGTAISSGENEVYADVKIWKLS